MKVPNRIAAAALCAISAALSLPAQTGEAKHARAIDGDTLEAAGQMVRLFGIDAPEGRQSCTRDGVAWLCGQEAAKALRSLIEGKAVTCEQKDRDRYGRAVSVCMAGGVDVGEWMVERGYALAYRRYSLRYVEAEDRAREAKRGLWAGEFQAPWDWRKAGP